MAKNTTKTVEKEEVKTAPETKNEVVETKTSLPTTFDAAAFSDAVDEEDIGMAEKVLPRLYLLQTLSPQLKKTQPEYIAGVEEGMILNVATNKLYSGVDGITIIPIYFRKTNIEWKPRDSGGGFVKDHGADILDLLKTCKKDAKGHILTAEGNNLVETYDYVVKIVDEKEGTSEDAIISMSSTNIKTGKQWNVIRSNFKYKDKNGEERVQAPFLHSYILRTVLNTKGKDTWFTYKIGYHKPVNEVMGDSAHKFCSNAVELLNNIKSGAINIAGGQADIANVEEGEDTPM